MRDWPQSSKQSPMSAHRSPATCDRSGSNNRRNLIGRDPHSLYQALCDRTRTRQDPCVLDTFISAVRFMEGAPARPWWSYTAERKKKFPASSLAPSQVCHGPPAKISSARVCPSPATPQPRRTAACRLRHSAFGIPKALAPVTKPCTKQKRSSKKSETPSEPRGPVTEIRQGRREPEKLWKCRGKAKTWPPRISVSLFLTS